MQYYITYNLIKKPYYKKYIVNNIILLYYLLLLLLKYLNVTNNISCHFVKMLYAGLYNNYSVIYLCGCLLVCYSDSIMI